MYLLLVILEAFFGEIGGHLLLISAFHRGRFVSRVWLCQSVKAQPCPTYSAGPFGGRKFSLDRVSPLVNKNDTGAGHIFESRSGPKTTGAHTESISTGPELIHILPAGPRMRQVRPAFYH
jgi:hypothetical protein